VQGIASMLGVEGGGGIAEQRVQWGGAGSQDVVYCMQQVFRMLDVHKDAAAECMSL
jgi:hypothetical protein